MTDAAAPMTFDGALDALRDHKDCMVEVTVKQRTALAERDVASYAGQLKSVERAGGRFGLTGSAWCCTLDTGLSGMAPTLTLDKDLFDRAMLADRPTGSDFAAIGTELVLTIEQGDLVVDVLIYAIG
jgi:hypothetical protein